MTHSLLMLELWTVAETQASGSPFRISGVIHWPALSIHQYDLLESRVKPRTPK
jgi:hypothetical protein